MKIYRFRLVRLIGSAVERMAYIGPRKDVPAGWSVAVRRAVA
jgi:hypothetical protein